MITGAGSGIGRAAAVLLAREGARVAALDQSEDHVREAVEEIRRRSGVAIPLVADVSRPGEVERAAAQQHGRDRLCLLQGGAGDLCQDGRARTRQAPRAR